MSYPKQIKEDLIAEFENSGVSIRQFAKDSDINPSTLSSWVRGAGCNKSGSKGINIEHPMPNFLKKLEKDVDVIKILGKLSERVEDHNQEDKDYCKIAIKTDRPICIIKAGDLHLGGLDVNYKSLLEHYKFLLEEPNFYLQLFGDDLNLMIMHKVTGARHDILTPDEQSDLLVAMVDNLLSKGKLLSMCYGNHSDEFVERTAGFGLVKLLVSKKVPYFSAMGYIDLVIGDQIYGEAFTHKTRFHSFMNAVHGNKRLQQCHAEYFGSNRPIAKCYITAHTHYPAVSMEGCLASERIYYIKVGTFKTEDIFARRYFGRGKIGCPSVVYFPNRLEHICFPTPVDAYRYMTGKDWGGLSNSEKK